MTQAADFIAALLAGKPAPVIERHTGMPYGWGLWLRNLKERLGAIGRETSDAIVVALAQRPLPPPAPRQPAMGRWQALRAMFYPGWDAPLREERGLRWFAGMTSLVMHLLFVLLLVLFALVGLPPPQPAQETTRVQVEFMGEGTPEEEGGGPPAAEASASAQAAPASAQPSVAQPATSSTVPVAAEPASTPPQEVAETPAPQAQQNVQVTETPVATIDFVLPPVTEHTPELAPPQVKPRELSVPVREVTVAVAPPVQRALPQREVAVRQASADAVPEVRQREIPAPLSQIRNVQVPARDLPTPEVRAATPGVRQAEIAMPKRGSATSSSNAPATQAASGNAGQTAATPQGTQPGATASGSGNANRQGASPTPRRGDDWGASTRNLPGQAGGATAGDGAGLFNADGSARVPDNATGNASRPGAPGSKQQQRADADRASKWLERPEYPYEPTMFDKYWVPSESVLAEWVRRAIREVDVPIPGTSKKVRCVVSVLQAGGACGLFDPNLNEQPATARPPPDIPVKRNPIPTDS